MTTRKRLILFSVASFIVGMLVTASVGYLVALPITRLFAMGHLYTAVSGGKMDVVKLRKLRSGDTQGTIQTLEVELDMHIITLGSYIDYPHDKQTRSIASAALLEIAKYRRDYPTTQEDPATRLMIERSLSGIDRYGRH